MIFFISSSLACAPQKGYDHCNGREEGRACASEDFVSFLFIFSQFWLALQGKAAHSSRSSTAHPEIEDPIEFERLSRPNHG
jgi:hypothetical protein